MKTKGGSLVAAFLLLIGLFGIIKSANFQYWESMTLPLIASSLVFILAGVQLAMEWYHRPSNEVAVTNQISEVDESHGKAEIKRGGIIFSWAAVFVLATYLLGFYLSVPFFTFAYQKSNARSWHSAIIFAVVVLAFVYLVFNIVLTTPLYQGLIFSIW